jgi:hypothetical protein
MISAVDDPPRSMVRLAQESTGLPIHFLMVLACWYLPGYPSSNFCPQPGITVSTPYCC